MLEELRKIVELKRELETKLDALVPLSDDRLEEIDQLQMVRLNTLYCAILHCNLMYCTVPYYTVLLYAILLCAVLYSHMVLTVACLFL